MFKDFAEFIRRLFTQEDPVTLYAPKSPPPKTPPTRETILQEFVDEVVDAPTIFHQVIEYGRTEEIRYEWDYLEEFAAKAGPMTADVLLDSVGRPPENLPPYHYRDWDETVYLQLQELTRRYAEVIFPRVAPWVESPERRLAALKILSEPGAQPDELVVRCLLPYAGTPERFSDEELLYIVDGLGDHATPESVTALHELSAVTPQERTAIHQELKLYFDWFDERRQAQAEKPNETKEASSVETPLETR